MTILVRCALQCREQPQNPGTEVNAFSAHLPTYFTAAYWMDTGGTGDGRKRTPGKSGWRFRSPPPSIATPHLDINLTALQSN